ncbi:hypothetical protein [Cypionkella sp. TWP1-2-1b2]|uniref:hypothetical protein n=1 Tax=Cypionkella sp. TWP1-2-1b2 TaxID=2804675 RepID=UPI003CFA83C2
MTPTPHLQAAAMRARAADAADNAKGGAYHVAGKAIRALPLEATPAELLAEAKKLPEIAVLIMIASAVLHFVPMHGPMFEQLKAALAALETP